MQDVAENFILAMLILSFTCCLSKPVRNQITSLFKESELFLYCENFFSVPTPMRSMFIGIHLPNQEASRSKLINKTKY